MASILRLCPAKLATPKTYLALDYGTKRIGLAVGNDLTRTAQPIAAIETQQLVKVNGKLRVEMIDKLVHEWKIRHIVFGSPLNTDGKKTAFSQKIENIGDALSKLLDIPVSYADERYTSAAADLILREQQQPGKKLTARKVSLRDSIAAQLILEAFFAQQSG